MTTHDVTTYRLDELTYDEFDPLGEGGAAEIFRCTTSSGQPYILKLYNDEVMPKIDFDRLRALIAWPAQLDSEDRDRLMKMCAWPQALVVADGSGAPRGLLMAEAPERFFLERNGKTEPRHFSRVAVPQERAESHGHEYYDFPHKIALLGHLLAGLQFLHSHKIVIGDLQWNNVLVTGPNPSGGQVVADIHFLDCDSFILNGAPALPLMDPLAWKPQFHTDGFSAETDMFKCALFVIRCLSEKTNQDSIAFADYKELLPSDDFEIIHELLTKPSPRLGAEQLGAMARAWQLSVRADGKLYRRTDQFARQTWTPEMRATHLAGIAAAKPREPVVPTYTSNIKSGTGSGGSSSKTVPPVSTPSGGSSNRGKWILIGIAAVVILIMVIWAVADDSSSSSRSSSTYRPTTSYSPTPTTTPVPTFTKTGDVYTNAVAGDCINRVVGADNGDGTAAVTVSFAACGTSLATDVVTLRASDVSACGADWVRRGTDVLCLRPT